MSLRVPFCLVVFGNVVAQDMSCWGKNLFGTCTKKFTSAIARCRMSQINDES
jgi:hypothetical protein